MKGTGEGGGGLVMRPRVCRSVKKCCSRVSYRAGNGHAFVPPTAVYTRYIFRATSACPDVIHPRAWLGSFDQLSLPMRLQRYFIVSAESAHRLRWEGGTISTCLDTFVSQSSWPLVHDGKLEARQLADMPRLFRISVNVHLGMRVKEACLCAIEDGLHARRVGEPETAP